MFQRPSLRWPITLGVTMIVLVVFLTVGWVLLSVFGAHWTLLAVGAVALAFMLTGVIYYLVLTIGAVNLSRRQSNFMDSVTHELKSPIASLKLYLQTLNLRKVSDDERENFYHHMLEDVERLDALINHLLVAARVERTPEPGENAPLDLMPLLERVGETVRKRYRKSPESFTFDLEPCVIESPQLDVEVIFQNLIDNAVKYGGDPTEVHISLRRSDQNEAIVEVRDNGRGIPRPMRRKIFQRFVRLVFELQRDTAGTGLGLYIVNTLVNRLRGKIRITDPESGTGTIFEVVLPALDEQPSKPPKKPAETDLAAAE